MARAAKKTGQPKSLEQRLWEAAGALRGNEEPSEYTHVVLGLVFLKYISDDFEARRSELGTELIADGNSVEVSARLAVRRQTRSRSTSHRLCPRTRVGTSRCRCR